MVFIIWWYFISDEVVDFRLLKIQHLKLMAFRGYYTSFSWQVWNNLVFIVVAPGLLNLLPSQPLFTEL